MAASGNTPSPRRPTAHLIHGFLAAGKTTFARRLSADTGAILFSVDEWYLRLYTDGTPTAHLDHAWYLRLEAQLDTLWPQLLSRGLDVILDCGFWTRAYRDRTRRLAAAVGAAVVLYAITCDAPTARRRLAARNQDPRGSFVISATAYEELRQRFMPLETDEDHVLVTESMPP